MDDLAQCAVGRQTVVIRKMLETAQIITFGCDRPNLGISPTSTLFCSVVDKFVVAADPFQRHAEDSRSSSGHGWWCQACCADHEKALVKAAKRSRRLGVIRCHTKKASGLHGTRIWHCSGVGAAGHGHRAFHQRRALDLALRMPYVPSHAGASHPAMQWVCRTMPILPCRSGSNVSNSGLISGMRISARTFPGLGE